MAFAEIEAHIRLLTQQVHSAKDNWERLQKEHHHLEQNIHTHRDELMRLEKILSELNLRILSERKNPQASNLSALQQERKLLQHTKTHKELEFKKTQHDLPAIGTALIDAKNKYLELNQALHREQAVLEQKKHALERSVYLANKRRA